MSEKRSRVQKASAVKIQKGMRLHFHARNASEEIVKSSNNRSTGMIRTLVPELNRFKEYTVDFILKSIHNGEISLQTLPIPA